MRILFDHQAFSMQTRGGISRFFAELIHNLRKAKENQVDSVFGYNENIHLQSKSLKNRSFLSSLLFSIQSSFKDKVLKNLLPHFNKFLSILQLSKNKYDVFIPTYFDPYFLKYLGKTPFILTVYDMIHELMPNEFASTDKTATRKKLLIEKASVIVAISQSTKDDILKLYPNTSADKIKVIYLAHEKINLTTESLINLPKEYILFVGKRASYKNFDMFFEAIKNIMIEKKSLHFICVGGGQFNSSEQEKFKSYQLSDRIKQLNVNDIELTHIYKNALFFTFPSLYEGFGIPVLEAMAEGCPVLLGNLSSFPEVAGDAGYYCDVSNKDSIEQAVNELLNDASLRSDLSKKGKLQANKFSWSRNATEWNEILNSLD